LNFKGGILFKKQITSLTALAAFFSLLLIFASCSDNSVTTQTDNLSFSYAGTSDTVDNAGILVLDTVKILLKDIKLNVAHTNDSTNFKTGPYVLNLNFNSLVTTIGSAYIPVGTYDKVKFEVHKLETNEPVPDPEFRDSVDTYSVVVKGTYNGVRFVFKSDKSAKQQLAFPNSLVVTSTSSNITLKIYPYLWFIDSNNMYIDPSDPANHNTIDNNIKDNIKGNFKAFKDNDKNGIPD
jgi:hypothetical protein